MVGVNKKKLNVGMVGYKFMGKAHSHAYKDVGMFFDADADVVMKAICGRDEQGVKEAADKFGWESYETDWRKMVARDDIDFVDINAPSDAHKAHLFLSFPISLLQTLHLGCSPLATRGMNLFSSTSK